MSALNEVQCDLTRCEERESVCERLLREAIDKSSGWDGEHEFLERVVAYFEAKPASAPQEKSPAPDDAEYSATCTVCGIDVKPGGNCLSCGTPAPASHCVCTSTTPICVQPLMIRGRCGHCTHAFECHHPGAHPVEQVAGEDATPNEAVPTCAFCDNRADERIGELNVCPNHYSDAEIEKQPFEEIGKLRRELLLDRNCKWNGWVRDATAEIERPNMLVSRPCLNHMIALYVNSLLIAQPSASQQFEHPVDGLAQRIQRE